MSEWHHAPVHHLKEGSTVFITGATYQREQFYREPVALDELQAILFAETEAHGCWLQSWALLTNHYHLVVRSGRVREMIAAFHSRAARALNEREGVRGRRVWFQYWDKTLTYEGSWLARLRYTNENPAHHGVVADARKYRWCSASWFETTAPAKFVDAVSKVKIDALRVYDPFEPLRGLP